MVVRGEQEKEENAGGSSSRGTRHSAVGDAFVCLPHVDIVSAVVPFFSHLLCPLHPSRLVSTEVMFTLLDAAAGAGAKGSAAKVACIESDAL